MRLYLQDNLGLFENLQKAASRTGAPGGSRTAVPGSSRTGNPGGMPRTGNPGGGSRTSVGPRTGSGSGSVANAMSAAGAAPSTPSGASGVSKVPTPPSGTSDELVDCPLGGACPDGGKHRPGSATFAEHQKQAAQGATGGQPAQEPAEGELPKDVTPATENIGSIGSDRVDPHAHTQEMASAVDPHAKTQAVPQVAPEEPPTPGLPDNAPEWLKNKNKPLSPEAGARRKRRELPFTKEGGETAQAPESEKQVADEAPAAPQEPTRAYDSPRNPTNEVPNPLDPETAPEEASPMDHYRLAKVARDMGEEEFADKHENLAKEKTKGWGAEQHRELSDSLRASGFDQHADYHHSVHKKASQEPDPYESVHTEQSEKADKLLKEAKDKHQETKKKADDIRAANKKKLEQHEAAMKEYEEQKAAGNKKAKKPAKPKLEKEPKVPDRPDLSEPADDSERLAHTQHTSKAKDLADKLESHLKNNPELKNKEQLELAHKILALNAKIKHMPDAKHKAEVAAAEKLIREAGIKEHWDDIENKKTKQAFEELNAKVADFSKKKEAQEKTEAKAKAKEETASAKQKAKEEKEQAKKAKQEEKAAAKARAEEGYKPETDFDNVKVQDHRGRATNLRDNIQQHLENNPDLSDLDRAKARNILTALNSHINMENVPGKKHSNQLSELEKLAGPMSQSMKDKKEFVPGTRTEARQNVNYMFGKMHEGVNTGATLANAAVSPRGAGQVGQAAVNYGGSGVVSVGHKLLHESVGQEGHQVVTPAPSKATPEGQPSPETPPVQQEQAKQRETKE